MPPRRLCSPFFSLNEILYTYVQKVTNFVPQLCHTYIHVFFFRTLIKVHCIIIIYLSKYNLGRLKTIYSVVRRHRFGYFRSFCAPCAVYLFLTRSEIRIILRIRFTVVKYFACNCENWHKPQYMY